MTYSLGTSKGRQHRICVLRWLILSFLYDCGTVLLVWYFLMWRYTVTGRVVNVNVSLFRVLYEVITIANICLYYTCIFTLRNTKPTEQFHNRIKKKKSITLGVLDYLHFRKQKSSAHIRKRCMSTIMQRYQNTLLKWFIRGNELGQW
jgi:hypothetical protein